MVLNGPPSYTILQLRAGADAPARTAMPPCYACAPEALDRLGSDAQELLTEAAALATARWGSDRFLIDAQVVDARPGTFPGIPVWSAAPASSTGEVLLACLADDALLEIEIDGSPVAAPADALVAVASGTRLRFRDPPREQVVAILLLRPRDGLQAWNRPRHCARVFSPRPTSFALREVPPISDPPKWSRDTSLRFTSGFQPLDHLPAFSEAQIAAEPLFNGGSVAFAHEYGGPLVRAYIERLPADWREDPDIIIQVKRDELSPGWWPALLEWHMDGTSRSNKRSDGTPDLRNPVRRAQQLAACIGSVSPTALLEGELALPEAPVGTDRDLAHAVWQQRIREHLAHGTVRPTIAPCNRLFLFGWGGFHACSPAKGPGWRCFIKTMRGRGDVPSNRVTRRSTVAWPSDGSEWPTDPLGIFPQDLPLA